MMPSIEQILNETLPKDTILYFASLLITAMQAEVERMGGTSIDQHSRKTTSHTVIPNIIWSKIDLSIKCLAGYVDLNVHTTRPYFIGKGMVQVEFRK